MQESQLEGRGTPGMTGVLRLCKKGDKAMAAGGTRLLEQVRSEVGRRRRELDLLAQKPFTRAGMTKKNSAEGAIAQLDLQPAAGVPARVRLDRKSVV